MIPNDYMKVHPAERPTSVFVASPLAEHTDGNFGMSTCSFVSSLQQGKLEYINISNAIKNGSNKVLIKKDRRERSATAFQVGDSQGIVCINHERTSQGAAISSLDFSCKGKILWSNSTCFIKAHSKFCKIDDNGDLWQHRSIAKYSGKRDDQLV